jgi:hypothetical protein
MAEKVLRKGKETKYPSLRVKEAKFFLLRAILFKIFP